MKSWIAAIIAIATAVGVGAWLLVARPWESACEQLDQVCIKSANTIDLNSMMACRAAGFTSFNKERTEEFCQEVLDRLDEFKKNRGRTSKFGDNEPEIDKVDEAKETVVPFSNMPLTFRDLRAEWFNANSGGRRLTIRGVLVHNGATEAYENIKCPATLTLHFKGKPERSFSERDICGVYKALMPGEQAKFHFSTGFLVARKWTAYSFDRIQLEFRVRARTPFGKAIVGGIYTADVPEPSFRQPFVMTPNGPPVYGKP